MTTTKSSISLVTSPRKIFRFFAAVILLHLLMLGTQCNNSAESSVSTNKSSETSTEANEEEEDINTNKAMIRYAALGDSYTIGECVKEDERWPNLMVAHLQEAGIDIQVVANPSVTGWTTKDLIEKELPTYRDINPQFATLLIGVNDWVQGFTKDQFRENLGYIMDEMLNKLSSNNHLVIVTIPDFGSTPEGPKYSKGRDITGGLAEFNVIIEEEAASRKLSVADIFPISQGMKDNADLVCSDGLHPSPKEYALWEEIILPVVKKRLTI